MNAPDTGGAEPQSDLEPEARRRVAATYNNDAQPPSAPASTGRRAAAPCNLYNNVAQSPASPVGERQPITDFMARVVPWPAAGAPGVVNLEWFQRNFNDPDPKKRFETGVPFVAVDQLLARAAYNVTNRARGYQDTYFCLSLQSSWKTSKSGKSLRAKRSKDCVLGYKSVWMDMDVKPGGYTDTSEAIKALGAFVAKYQISPPNAMVRSGSGGLHVYWIGKDVMTIDQWLPLANRLKQAAEQFGLHFDAKCTVNPVQILRVPGTLNFKSQPPKAVRLSHLAPDLDLQIALIGLPALATSIVTAPVTAMSNPDLFPIRDAIENDLCPVEKFQHVPLDPRPILAQCPMFKEQEVTHGKGVPQGVWMNMALACTFLDGGRDLFHRLSDGYDGYDKVQAEDMWQRKLKESSVTVEGGLRWPSCDSFESFGCKNCTNCSLKNAIHSPLNLGQRVAAPVIPPGSTTDVPPNANSAPNTAPSRAVHVSSLPLVPPKRLWLHGTDLIRGAVTVLYAPGGRAKSTWLLTCALACASGRPLLGSHIFGGPLRVLYLSAEDRMHEMALRLRATMKHHGLTDADLPALHIIGSDLWGLPLMRAQGNCAVLDQHGIGALTAEVDQLMPDVLIIDPLINVLGGANANDNATAALLMGHLAGLAATRRMSIALAHHVSKGRDVTSAESAMGAASFVNLSRIALAIEFLNDKDAGTVGLAPWEAWRIFRVLQTKGNFSPPNANDRWFRLHSVEIPNADPPIYIDGDGVAVVEPFTPGVSSSAFSDQLLRDALVSVDQAMPPLSPSKRSSGRYAAPVIAQAIARHRGGQSSEIEGDAVLRHLLKSGLILVDEVKLGRPGGRSDTRKGLVLTPAGKAIIQQSTATADVTPQSPQSPATTLQNDAGGDPLGPPQRKGGYGGNAGTQSANDNAEQIARCG